MLREIDSVFICFVLCLSCSWCTTCGVFPACEPGRSGKSKPRGESRRSFCSEGLHSPSESSNNHPIQEPRGAPQVLALLPASNTPKATTRLWSICYQPGKMLETRFYTAVTTVRNRGMIALLWKAVEWQAGIRFLKKRKRKKNFFLNAFDGKPEISSSAHMQFTLKSFCLKKPLGEEERIPNSTTQLIISFQMSFFLNCCRNGMQKFLRWQVGINV